MTQPYPPPPYAPQAASQPLGYADPNVPIYLSSAGRGRVLRALLWTMLALTLLGGVWTAYELTLPPGALDRDDVEIPIGALLALIGWALATVTAFIATVVVFCMWMYRAHANLSALGTRGLDYTSGWAAGAWFVPFLNLVRPYRIMKEIWKGSDPAHLASSEFAWKLAADPPLVGWWWAAWIISLVASRISSRMDRAGDFDVQYASLFVDLANVPLTAAAAWLAIGIVARIDAMQSARSDAIRQYYAGACAAPPPQPVLAAG